jgi:hypothetical protein
MKLDVWLIEGIFSNNSYHVKDLQILFTSSRFLHVMLKMSYLVIIN